MPELHWFPLWNADKLHAFRGKNGGTALCGVRRQYDLPTEMQWFRQRVDAGPPRCANCVRCIEEDQARAAAGRKRLRKFELKKYVRRKI